MHSWEIHGPRLLVFLVAAIVALTSTGLAFGRLFLGSEAERSIRCMLLVTLLVACWLAFFTSWERLSWLAFQYRVGRHHDAMKAAVTRLSDQWPTDGIDLPGLGGYEMANDNPNLPFIEGPCPDGLTDFSEAFDRIRRSKEGGFSFAVGSYPGYWVHFFPQDQKPQSYTRNKLDFTASFDLQTVVDLGEGWYLAYYEVTIDDG